LDCIFFQNANSLRVQSSPEYVAKESLPNYKGYTFLSGFKINQIGKYLIFESP